jgi:hypothetical protein
MLLFELFLWVLGNGFCLDAIKIQALFLFVLPPIFSFALVIIARPSPVANGIFMSTDRWPIMGFSKLPFIIHTGIYTCGFSMPFYRARVYTEQPNYNKEACNE